MEKNIKMTLLFDIYGKLLTTKQKDMFEEYYLFNLSLREIATNKNISYQAVRDSIKSSENMLENFEENIGMLKLKENVLKVCDMCKEDNLNLKKSEILKILSEDGI